MWVQLNETIIMENKTKENTYHHIFKCSSSRCKCCTMLVCKNNIRSTVNNRVFNTVFPEKNISCNSKDIIYVLTCKAFNCNI